MNAINYIIVDDEPLAHKNIENHAVHFDWLHKIGEAYDAIQAIHLLKTKSVDLVFLDIEMPKITGLQLLATLTNPPKIIICSAYKEYAIDGYEYDVIDYLLKPFSLERFTKAVHKMPIFEQTKATSPSKQILVKENGITHKINCEQIQYIEAYGNYVKIHIEGKFRLDLKSLSQYESILQGQNFVRIHKSYVVNKSKIKSFSPNAVFVDGNELPIGKLYKKGILDQLKEV